MQLSHLTDRIEILAECVEDGIARNRNQFRDRRRLPVENNNGVNHRLIRGNDSRQFSRGYFDGRLAFSARSKAAAAQLREKFMSRRAKAYLARVANNTRLMTGAMEIARVIGGVGPSGSCAGIS